MPGACIPFFGWESFTRKKEHINVYAFSYYSTDCQLNNEIYLEDDRPKRTCVRPPNECVVQCIATEGLQTAVFCGLNTKQSTRKCLADTVVLNRYTNIM